MDFYNLKQFQNRISIKLKIKKKNYMNIKIQTDVL